MSDGWGVERLNMHECDLLLQVERLGISQWNDTSLRADDIRHDVPVCVGVAEVCDEVHYLAPKRKQIGRHRLTVVDDLISAEIQDPFGPFRDGRLWQ
jgi:hypothetical protein